MTAKSAVVVGLVPLCLVPAAVVGYANDVRLQAFSYLAEVANCVEYVIAIAPRAESKAAEDPPVVRRAQTTRVAAYAREAGARDAFCTAWLPLTEGPRARAAASKSVRSCDGPPPRDMRSQEQAIVAAAGAQVSHGPRLQYEVDLAAPR